MHEGEGLGAGGAGGAGGRHLHVHLLAADVDGLEREEIMMREGLKVLGKS